ncbi:hypothetical protein PMAYCL1PPCAC_25855, partial [Pristionchus mayeri]
DECRRSMGSFRKVYEAAYNKSNPSKRLRLTEEEESPSHHTSKQGFVIHKNKPDRYFELTQSTIFTSMEVLYLEMDKLQKQMNAITQAITDLANSIPNLLMAQIGGITNQMCCEGGHSLRQQGPSQRNSGFSEKPSVGEAGFGCGRGAVQEDQHALASQSLPSEGEGILSSSLDKEERCQIPLPSSHGSTQLFPGRGETIQGRLGRCLHQERCGWQEGIRGEKPQGRKAREAERMEEDGAIDESL